MEDLDAYSRDLTKDMTHEEALNLIMLMPASAVGSPLALALLARIAERD